jgi:hypothetical protein
MLAMVCENVLVVFFSPNGITFHSYRPNLEITIIFFTSLRTIKICQNPYYKSSAETIWSALNDSKHPQLWAWEKSLALFDNSMDDSFQKIFDYHLSSFVKLFYKRTLMHSCASFPNPPRLVFAN